MSPTPLRSSRWSRLPWKLSGGWISWSTAPRSIPSLTHNTNLLALHGPGTGAFEDFPLEAWNQALAVNLTGAFLCCQAAVQPMLAQGSGVIINLSSIYGLAGPDQRLYQRAGASPPQYKPVYYSVTKAGILGLTRYLATYYAGKNIRVNALTPGGVYQRA